MSVQTPLIRTATERRRRVPDLLAGFCGEPHDAAAGLDQRFDAGGRVDAVALAGPALG
jgi:hypothetical protein